MFLLYAVIEESLYVRLVLNRTSYFRYHLVIFSVLVVFNYFAFLLFIYPVQVSGISVRHTTYLLRTSLMFLLD